LAEEKDKQYAERLITNCEDWRNQYYTSPPSAPVLPYYSPSARNNHIHSIHDINCSCRTWDSLHCQLIHNRFCRCSNYSYSPENNYNYNYNISNSNQKHVHGWRCCQRSLEVGHIHSNSCQCILRPNNYQNDYFSIH